VISGIKPDRKPSTSTPNKRHDQELQDHHPELVRLSISATGTTGLKIFNCTIIGVPGKRPRSRR